MKVPQSLRWIFDQPQTNTIEIIEEHTDSAKRRLYDVAALIALASVCFFFGAGKIALLGPDEPRYAEVAREMFASGDYLSPRLCGCLWFEKPVLFYWLAAGAYHLFGVSEFSARFASGFMAAITLLALYFALSKAISTQLARSAAFALLTSAFFMVYARAATPDMSLAAGMAIAILAGYLTTRSKGREATGYMTLCFAAMGLSLLAKGLVGPVLVGAILLVYLIIAGRLRFIRWRFWLIWVLAFLLVAATWYIPVTVKHGWQFINEFFIEHHFKRYLTNTYGHPQPFYFFTVIAVVGILPLTFFFIPAIFRIRSLRPRMQELDSLLTLAWIWLIIPLLFFSISESKLPGYLLPVFPALAIIIGAELERFLTGERTRVMNVAGWLTVLMTATMALGFFWFVRKEGGQLAGFSSVLSLLPSGFSGLTLWAMVNSKRREALACIAAVVLSIVIGGATLLFPKLNDEISLKKLSLEAAAALRPDEKIGFYILKEFSPVFYAEGRVVCGMGEGDVLNALREDKLVAPLEIYPSIIFITRERWIAGLMKDPRFDVEYIAQQGEFYAFRVNLKPGYRIQDTGFRN
jgi:4-amino-4-deoxy-L-arabinose transferase-like glycosyltransferase